MARLLTLGAALVAAGGVLVALADDGSSDSPEREGTAVALAGAPPSAEPGPSTRGLGLPPLPPFPTYVPDAALAEVALPAPGGVAVFGDSLALQAWPYLQAIADHQGRPLYGAAYGGAALCDWLPTMRDVLLEERPAEVVLAFAGNNLTPCVAMPDGERAWGADLAARYVRDATRAIELARATGARVDLVGPPDMGVEPQATHARLLREAFERLARALDVDYADAASRLSSDGYDTTQPCLDFEGDLGCTDGRITVRAGDGVHLSSPDAAGYSAGAWRYAALLLD